MRRYLNVSLRTRSRGHVLVMSPDPRTGRPVPLLTAASLGNIAGGTVNWGGILCSSRTGHSFQQRMPQTPVQKSGLPAMKPGAVAVVSAGYR